MYNKGAKRLLKDFNIERLVSDMKDIKNIIRLKFKGGLDKKKIKTCRSKVLELDKVNSDNSSDCSENGVNNLPEDNKDLFDGALQINDGNEYNWPKIS